MRIYTGAGDAGDTGLLFGGRVPKDDPRCQAYGEVDTAVSAMGLARALAREPRVREVLLRVQREMFTVGAELETDATQYHRFRERFGTVTSEMVCRLEQTIDELLAHVELPDSFIVPGGSPASAALDLARGLLRGAERHIVTMRRQGLLANPEVLRYVNRLSDLLFVLARYEDRGRPAETVKDARRG